MNTALVLNDSDLTFNVFVDYKLPTDLETLEAEFSKDGVAEELYEISWKLDPSCAEIDQTPGNRVMLLKCFKRDTTPEENITEMGKLGFHPAIHLEAYAFAKANPDLQLQYEIVALGSYGLYIDGYTHLVVLDSDSGQRIFCTQWAEYLYGYQGYSELQFLFVRK
ncbi:MAG: hypothetical protein WA001_02830 [Patescibacteria group bacterium]